MKTLLLALAAAAVLAVAPSTAQTYPTRPITMLVPFAAGGTTDVLARILAEDMGKTLGQNVIVENVGGAGGRSGTERVIRGEPDGYTILFGNMGPMAASKALFKDQRYDPRTDLAPVGLVADVPMVIAASKKSGMADLKSFIAKIKAEGDKVTFGTAGFGATSDLAPRLLLHLSGLKSTVVPYKGAGPAIQDLIGGFVDGVRRASFSGSLSKHFCAGSKTASTRDDPSPRSLPRTRMRQPARWRMTRELRPLAPTLTAQRLEPEWLDGPPPAEMVKLIYLISWTC